MKAGGGKAKGGQFERETAVKLSLWVTHGSKRDVFWRSAMSGGRATVHGVDIRQCGDICSVAPEGHVVTDRWLIECKHVRDLNLWGIIEKKGKLFKFWKRALTDAHRWGKLPILIAAQNHRPTLFCIPGSYIDNTSLVIVLHSGMEIHLFDEVLKHKFKPF